MLGGLGYEAQSGRPPPGSVLSFASPRGRHGWRRALTKHPTRPRPLILYCGKQLTGYANTCILGHAR